MRGPEIPSPAKSAVVMDGRGEEGPSLTFYTVQRIGQVVQKKNSYSWNGDQL